MPSAHFLPTVAVDDGGRRVLVRITDLRMSVDDGFVEHMGDLVQVHRLGTEDIRQTVRSRAREDQSQTKLICVVQLL